MGSQQWNLQYLKAFSHFDSYDGYDWKQSIGSLIQSQIHADLVRFESAYDRYKKLCHLQPQIIMRAPLLHIASYLQMTPETLSRVRAQMLNEE